MPSFLGWICCPYDALGGQVGKEGGSEVWEEE